MSRRCCVCGGTVWNGRCSLCGMPEIDESSRYHLNEDRAFHEKECETPRQRAREAKQADASFETMMTQRDKDQKHHATLGEELRKEFTRSVQNAGYGQSAKGTPGTKSAQNMGSMQGARSMQNNQNTKNKKSIYETAKAAAANTKSIYTAGDSGGGNARSSFSGLGQTMQRTAAKNANKKSSLGWIIFILVIVVAVGGEAASSIFENVKESFTTSSPQMPVSERYEYDPYADVLRELSTTGDSYTDTFQNTFLRVGWQIPEGNYTVTLAQGDWVSMEISDPENYISIYQTFVTEEEVQDYLTYELSDVRLYEGAWIEVSGSGSLRFASETAQMAELSEERTNPLTDTIVLDTSDVPHTYTAGSDFDPGMYDIALASGNVSLIYTNQDWSTYISMDDYDIASEGMPVQKQVYFAKGDTLTIDSVYSDRTDLQLIPSNTTYEIPEEAGESAGSEDQAV